MAFTVHQQPTAVSLASKPFIGTSDYATFVVEETDAAIIAQPRFSYILQVYEGLGPLVEVFAGLNSENCGVFEIAKILNDYVMYDEVDSSGQAIHQITVGANSINLTGNKLIRLGYRYATSVSSSSYTVTFPDSSYLYYWKGGIYPVSLPSTATPLNTYIPNDQFRKVLSVSDVHYVTDSDQGIFAFTNNLDNTVNTQVVVWRVQYKDVAGNVLSTSGLTNGVAGSGNSDITYFFCGPFNLKNQTLNPSASPGDAANAGWDSYEIAGFSNLTFTTQRTQTYTFKRIDCSRYTSYRLAFLNGIGGWDYLTFDKSSKTTTSVQTREYDSSGSTAYTAGSGGLNYYPWQGGRQQYDVKGVQQMTLNTGFRGAEMKPLMEALLQSPKVYIQEFGWLPVVITDRAVTYKIAENQELSQYSVAIEFGKNNNSL